MKDKKEPVDNWKLMMCSRGYVDENGDCETPDGLMKSCSICRYGKMSTMQRQKQRTFAYSQTN